MFKCLIILSLGFGADALEGSYPQVRVVHVPAPEPGILEWLVTDGFVVDHVTHDGFEVYVPESDWPRFEALEIPHSVMEIQPTAPVYQPGAKGLGVYHSYSALTSELQDYAAAYPDIARLTSLGQSVQGRELWALKITDNPDTEEDEPEFKYVSTMHGDEPVGTELMLYLIDRLLSDYGADPRITALVDETEIWIVPLMNPDGFAANSRMNAQALDLNRVFPTYGIDFSATAFHGAPLGTAGRPPEVARIMEWSAGQSFVLSANLHTGALVVNYPFDDDGLPSGQYAASPDDDLFVDVSLRYSSNNPPMYASTTFPQGITNGCQWYRITGGMQDWNYRYLGTNEVTLELAVPKRPAEAQLPTYWTNNEESLLQYLEAVHLGIRGVIEDAVTGEPVSAMIIVEGNPQPAFTDPDVGDYHRMLLPGTYTITAYASGYFPASAGGITVTGGAATRMDLAMQPLASMPVGRSSLWVLAVALAALGIVNRKSAKIVCSGMGKQ